MLRPAPAPSSMPSQAGEEKPASVSQKQGFVVLSSWSAKPDPEWGLRVRMKTPKTLARYSLALKDVPLP